MPKLLVWFILWFVVGFLLAVFLGRLFSIGREEDVKRKEVRK